MYTRVSQKVPYNANCLLVEEYAQLEADDREKGQRNRGL